VYSIIILVSEYQFFVVVVLRGKLSQENENLYFKLSDCKLFQNSNSSVMLKIFKFCKLPLYFTFSVIFKSHLCEIKCCGCLNFITVSLVCTHISCRLFPLSETSFNPFYILKILIIIPAQILNLAALDLGYQQ
jgi:hypothetical protein